MKKFKYLVKYGLLKRVGRKAFLISNIVVALLLIAIINLPSIIALFSSGDDEKTNMYVDVINETSQVGLAEDLEEQFNQPFQGYRYYVMTELEITQFDVEAFWADTEKDIVYHFSGDINKPNIVVYSKSPELSSQHKTQIELLIINYQLIDYESPTFSDVLAPDYEDPEEGYLISSITTILILPMFILLTMATQFVGVEIIEEKSTKAIETIIASVPAKIHFLSKITASILFVIIQGVLVMGYSAIGSLIGGASANSGLNLPTNESSLIAYLGEVFPNWPLILMFTLSFMIIGTLFYLVLAALFASMATTQEDYQQFQSPLMLMLVAGFYITIFAPMAGGETFLKIMSFIPIFTPIVAPVAYASGVMTGWEALIALLVVSLFLIGALYIVSPIYKVAILSYDQTKFFKRIGDYIKKAFPKKVKNNQ